MTTDACNGCLSFWPVKVDTQDRRELQDFWRCNRVQQVVETTRQVQGVRSGTIFHEVVEEAMGIRDNTPFDASEEKFAALEALLKVSLKCIRGLHSLPGYIIDKGGGSNSIYSHAMSCTKR